MGWGRLPGAGDDGEAGLLLAGRVVVVRGGVGVALRGGVRVGVGVALRGGVGVGVGVGELAGSDPELRVDGAGEVGAGEAVADCAGAGVVEPVPVGVGRGDAVDVGVSVGAAVPLCAGVDAGLRVGAVELAGAVGFGRAPGFREALGFAEALGFREALGFAEADGEALGVDEVGVADGDEVALAGVGRASERATVPATVPTTSGTVSAIAVGLLGWPGRCGLLRRAISTSPLPGRDLASGEDR